VSFVITVELRWIVIEFLTAPCWAPIGLSLGGACTTPSLPLIRLALALERLEFGLADGLVETPAGGGRAEYGNAQLSRGVVSAIRCVGCDRGEPFDRL
jgi:hypothetical protein